jgi:hypothetical protein
MHAPIRLRPGSKRDFTIADAMASRSMNDTLPCPYCPGAGELLGILGDLMHYRCRQCAGMFSSRMAQPTYDEEQQP